MLSGFPMNEPASVAVLGGGASGCLTAAHLARAAARTGRSLDLLLVEPAGPGRGVAYSTSDPRHRLNVPAANMSAWPDRPDHFLTWLRRHVDVDFPADAFAPRMHYGEYLRQTADEAVRLAPGVTLTHLPMRATDLRPLGRRLRLVLADGTTRAVDAAVLAIGYGTPATDWAPEALRRSPRFVADPWQPDLDLNLPPGSEIVLVGAGLTMSDMALRWGRSRVRLHVVSRHGMLPLPHPTGSVDPLPAPAVPASLTFDDVRRLLVDRIRATQGDWHAAVDGLRPVTNALWEALDPQQRQRFLSVGARRWDRMRHRVDPSLHAWLDKRCRDGTIAVHAGTVTGARDCDRGIEVTLSDGSAITAAAVFNCTGAASNVRTSADPLVMNLRATGALRPDPLDLGAETTADGRLCPDLAIWAIGPLRRGTLWECTAVPEIRCQAADLADAVLAAGCGSAARVHSGLASFHEHAPVPRRAGRNPGRYGERHHAAEQARGRIRRPGESGRERPGDAASGQAIPDDIHVPGGSAARHG